MSKTLRNKGFGIVGLKARLHVTLRVYGGRGAPTCGAAAGYGVLRGGGSNGRMKVRS